jgi:enamine deaminase RidA (YjgF/YER057c/UK114 family)
MMNTTAGRLAELGIELPPAAKPVANYIPWTRSGSLVFVSGQLPLRDGKVAASGLLGTSSISIEDANGGARLCGINLLAHVRDACRGNLDRVTAVLKLTGFVACSPDFVQHPQVINGASDLMVAVFGDKGRHARAAVGVASLPLNAAVEVEGIFEIR